MGLKIAHQDRIDEVVADNFVTDLWLAHPMSYLAKSLQWGVQDWRINQYHNLVNLLQLCNVAGHAPAQSPIFILEK